MKPPSMEKCKCTSIELIGLLILWLSAFYPVYPGLVERWFTNSDYSYGVLVPFIAVYFIWQKRDALRSAAISGSSWGMIILAVSLATYSICYIGGVAVAMRLAMVSSLLGIVLFVLGEQILKIILFPLLFLFFMVPIPESIEMAVTLPLQLLATRAAAGILNLLSIPFYREGNMLHFVKTQLEVAEACSGIRTITALSMLSAIFVHQMASGWKRQTLLFLSAVPIAMAANIIRVSGTGVLAHFYGERVARGFLHEFSGLVVFALGLVVLYVEFVLLNRKGPSRPKEVPLNIASRAKDYSCANQKKISNKHIFSTGFLLILSILTTISISTRGVPVVSAFNLKKLPIEIDGFVGQRDSFPQSVYDALNADENIYRHYRSPQGDLVDLYIGYYGTAKGGRTGHNPYGCLPGSGWGIITSEKLQIINPGESREESKKIWINHILARKGANFVNMYHWYQTRGNRVVDNGIQQNIERFLGRVMENRNDGAFVQISTFSKEESIDSAHELGKSFAENILRILPLYWPVEKEPSHK